MNGATRPAAEASLKKLIAELRALEKKAKADHATFDEFEVARNAVWDAFPVLAAAAERVEALEGALNISLDSVGQIMHESWTNTKRSQGFHHPDEAGHGITNFPCGKCHKDLVPWSELPEQQKDINRHAFDAVLAEIRRRAALAALEAKP